MSTTQYPLRKKLEEIEDSNLNDIHLQLELVKKVLVEELASRGLEDFKDARFDVAYSIKDHGFNVALSRMQLRAKLNFISKKLTKIELEFSAIPQLILILLDYHKPLLGNGVMDIIKEVFQENYENIIDAMSKEIGINIKQCMGTYYAEISPESHKANFQEYFNERFKGTFFESMVIDLTDDYVKNGECLRG